MWDSPKDGPEKNIVKILWDFLIKTNKLVMANQPDTVVVDER